VASPLTHVWMSIEILEGVNTYTPQWSAEGKHRKTGHLTKTGRNFYSPWRGNSN
jgi:hypothetical protein